MSGPGVLGAAEDANSPDLLHKKGERKQATSVAQLERGAKPPEANGCRVAANRGGLPCLGQYEIRSPLGAGGMGEVYRAHDGRLDRDVAIKVLPEYLAADPERLRRFEQEARATVALNHPNILTVFQMGDGKRRLISG